MKLKDGEPCDHLGCLNHVTHPCEGSGRIAGCEFRTLMGDTAYGRAALKKLTPVDENFVIYEAGWVGDHPSQWDVMKVRGANFRAALSGPRKGQLVIKIAGTERVTYVTRSEISEEK